MADAVSQCPARKTPPIPLIGELAYDFEILIPAEDKGRRSGRREASHGSQRIHGPPLAQPIHEPHGTSPVLGERSRSPSSSMPVRGMFAGAGDCEQVDGYVRAPVDEHASFRPE